MAEEEDVNAAVAAARAAFKPWSRTPGAERAKYLVRLADLLDEHIEELCRLEALCTGKPMAVARAREVPLASRLFRCKIISVDTFVHADGGLQITQGGPTSWKGRLILRRTGSSR